MSNALVLMASSGPWLVHKSSTKPDWGYNKNNILFAKPKSVQRFRASLIAQVVKILPTMQKTWVQSLGQEDPLEKQMATHSSILVKWAFLVVQMLKNPPTMQETWVPFLGW